MLLKIEFLPPRRGEGEDGGYEQSEISEEESHRCREEIVKASSLPADRRK